MGDRDRLIKLIQEAEDDYMVYEMGAQALAIGIFKSREEYIADHLIANGVIVQKQGEWVSCGIDNNDMEIIKCSECGRKQFGYSKFCATCGAKMKERDKK